MVDGRYEGLILCGGASRRLGRDKALLPIGGRPLVARVIDALGPVCSRLRLVGRPIEGIALETIPDREPFAGPVTAIALGLPLCETTRVYVVSCDMPFLTPSYFELLAARIGEADACLPWDGETRMPLAALYTRAVGEGARLFSERGGKALCDFVGTLRLSPLTSADLAGFPEVILQNVNTPDDASAAESVVLPT